MGNTEANVSVWLYSGEPRWIHYSKKTPVICHVFPLSSLYPWSKVHFPSSSQHYRTQTPDNGRSLLQPGWYTGVKINPRLNPQKFKSHLWAHLGSIKWCRIRSDSRSHPITLTVRTYILITVYNLWAQARTSEIHRVCTVQPTGLQWHPASAVMTTGQYQSSRVHPSTGQRQGKGLHGLVLWCMRTQDFLAEYQTVARWSLLFTSLLRSFWCCGWLV